ncbi:DUF58 domain-containing protein [Niallia nealsonii]|uniref:DUF58 domain-containing protein n=1 Tax=Niallia nealsonii TaxID=115979 RepID=A0A2N0YZR6_9BACI|nr:DUF58 domain-containing protein [Niallia nealsonii]PKG22752.1 DUF58 domain-containing protein [Niallia nealsonii]
MSHLKKMLTPLWKLILLFMLIGAAFAYAMFQGGFVSWFLFYSFLPFAVYGLLLVLYPLRDWEVTRKLAKHEYNAKEVLTVEIELKRKTFIPLFYLLVEDGISSLLTNKSMSKKLFFPGFKRTIHFTYLLDELPRGEHGFYHTTIKIGDPFGFMEKEWEIRNLEKIIVFPEYEEVIYKPFTNQYEQGMAASKNIIQRDTTMAVGIREYRPGDRFSWINWKASAKRNDIMIKEFEQRQTDDIFVVLDCKEHAAFETMVSFTATLIRSILKKGAQVGFLSMEKEKTVFSIRGGEVQQRLLFHHLAKLKNNSPVSLVQLLESEFFTFQQNTTIMLVTADLSKELIKAVSLLAGQKYNLNIFLVKDSNKGLSNEEMLLKSEAFRSRVRVILIEKGRFQDAFLEVETR